MDFFLKGNIVHKNDISLVVVALFSNMLDDEVSSVRLNHVMSFWLLWGLTHLGKGSTALLMRVTYYYYIVTTLRVPASTVGGSGSYNYDGLME